MAEHEISGRVYLTGKLNARQQFDVSRRLGIMSMLLEQPVADDHVEGARFIGGLAAGYLANVPQQDMDYILNTCLATVRTIRDPGGKAVPAMNLQTGLMQFDDIEMTTMLELVDLVIQENLLPFFEKLRLNREAVAGAGTE
jgi:hypothetical protein